MSETVENLNRLLREIEHELRAIDLWTDIKPDNDINHQNPPATKESLQWAQWVQWVMIPTFDELLKSKGQLPEFSSIAPMAELALTDANEKADQLLKLIQQLDNLINTRSRASLAD